MKHSVKEAAATELEQQWLKRFQFETIPTKWLPELETLLLGLCGYVFVSSGDVIHEYFLIAQLKTHHATLFQFNTNLFKIEIENILQKV